MSALAAEIIKRWEGLSLTAYHDAVGVLTIGYGHTGPDVTEGLTWTQDQADEALIHDMRWAIKAVTDGVRGSLSPNQEAAFVSLTYNTGASAFANSTVLRKFNDGDLIQTAIEFTRWHKAGGRPLKGLLRRRLDEAALFLKP